MTNRKITSKISILYGKGKRRYPKYKKKDKFIDDIWFHLYDSEDKRYNNPLGHTFEISAKHRSIEINGSYVYFKKEDFNKIMKDLKKLVDFYFKGLLEGENDNK